jgi:hypothetical protein
MKMKSARLAFLALSIFMTQASVASAGSASGSAALALAAVVAQYSPVLKPAEKKVVASLFAGNTNCAATGKISVTADEFMCRTSNVDLTSRSCELTFKTGKRSLKGREANELFATAALAGIPAEGAAGSNIESATKLNCTLDPQQIRQKDGGGASCSFDAGN